MDTWDTVWLSATLAIVRVVANNLAPPRRMRKSGAKTRRLHTSEHGTRMLPRCRVLSTVNSGPRARRCVRSSS